MAFTTMAGLVAGLAALSVPGVTRVYSAPPSQPPQTADLPAMYPRLPVNTTSVDTLNGDTGLRSATIDLVIAVRPLFQSTPAVNFTAAVTLLDSLHTVLANNALSLGIDSWEIRQGEELYDDETGMWALVATVRASG